MEAASTSWRSLGELFVERGLISEADLERALAEQVATKRRLADILVRRGLVTGHDITNALMEQLGHSVPQQTRPAVATAPAGGSTADAAASLAMPPASAPAPVKPAPAPVVEVVAMPEPPPAPPAPKAEPQERAEPKKQSAKKSEPKQAPPQQTLSAPVADELDAGTSISAHALIAEADARRRGAEAELNTAREAHAQVIRGLEQVRAELEARDLSTTGLVNEVEETQIRLRKREEELATEASLWEEARREAERCGGQLAELQGRLDEKESELSEASASAAAWTARSNELESEADALAGRVEAAVEALENLAATRFAANGADLSKQAVAGNGESRKRTPHTGVLYFVPKAEGYDLVEREGELPVVGEALEFGDQQFVVTKVGRSPLPFDRRSCVFLTAV